MKASWVQDFNLLEATFLAKVERQLTLRLLELEEEYPVLCSHEYAIVAAVLLHHIKTGAIVAEVRRVFFSIKRAY